MSDQLPVWSACTYPGTDLAGQRGVFLQDTWHAEKFVKAVKGDDLKQGYATVPVPIGDGRRMLTNANKDESRQWFAEMVAAAFRLPKELSLLLVPVPPHNGTDSTVIRKSRIWQLAEAVAARNRECTATVGVVWKKEMKSARRGGPRGVDTLLPNCATTDSIARRSNVLLLDDVITSGGHLAACAARLRDSGAKVLIGLCVGRTVSEQESAPFSWLKRVIELP